jgi:hypothetical protein
MYDFATSSLEFHLRLPRRCVEYRFAVRLRHDELQQTILSFALKECMVETFQRYCGLAL